MNMSHDEILALLRHTEDAVERKIMNLEEIRQAEENIEATDTEEEEVLPTPPVLPKDNSE